MSQEIKKTDKTIMVFSGSLDHAMAAFNIAVGAASMGFKVHMFFTFWGINILKKETLSIKNKDFMGKMFTLMMANGPTRLNLSKMNMGGLGTWMMKKRMESKNISLLPELIKMAQSMDINMMACDMTKEVMGIEDDDLIDGLDVQGVAGFMDVSNQSDTTLFI